MNCCPVAACSPQNLYKTLQYGCRQCLTRVLQDCLSDPAVLLGRPEGSRPIRHSLRQESFETRRGRLRQALGSEPGPLCCGPYPPVLYLQQVASAEDWQYLSVAVSHYNCMWQKHHAALCRVCSPGYVCNRGRNPLATVLSPAAEMVDQWGVDSSLVVVDGDLVTTLARRVEMGSTQRPDRRYHPLHPVRTLRIAQEALRRQWENVLREVGNVSVAKGVAREVVRQCHKVVQEAVRRDRGSKWNQQFLLDPFLRKPQSRHLVVVYEGTKYRFVFSQVSRLFKLVRYGTKYNSRVVQ